MITGQLLFMIKTEHHFLKVFKCTLMATEFYMANCKNILCICILWWGFPGGSVVKIPPANAGDVGLIPGLGRSPGEGKETLFSILGEGKGNPLWYSCLDRETW